MIIVIRRTLLGLIAFIFPAVAIAAPSASDTPHTDTRRPAGIHANIASRRLLAAAQNGYPELVERLLKAGVPVNARDMSFRDKGETPLHKAASGGNLRVMRLLLKAGAKVDARDERGETPLLQAAYMRRRAAVRLLLHNGAAPDGASKKGLFPMQTASRQGFLKINILLRRAGARVNQRDKLGRTALMAAGVRHPAMVRWLLAVGADANARTRIGTTALMVASAAGRTDIVKILIKAGANVNARRRHGKDALWYNTRAGYAPARLPGATLKVMALLWNHGARPADPALLMRTAVRRGNLDVLRYLMDKGLSLKDPRTYYTIPFNRYDGKRALYRFLRKHKAPIPPEDIMNAHFHHDYRLMMKRVAAGRFDPVQALGLILYPVTTEKMTGMRKERARIGAILIRRIREAGRKIPPELERAIWIWSVQWAQVFPVSFPFDRKLSFPRKLANVCSFRKRPDLLSRMIKGGLDIHARTRGATLLARSVSCGATDLVRILLRAGGNAKGKDWRGRPLTHIAGNAKMLKLLLAGGAEVHSSALCSVLKKPGQWNERLPVARLLLARGASPNCRYNSRRTLLGEAVLRKHESLRRLLTSAGARDLRRPLEIALRRNPAEARRLLASGKYLLRLNDIYSAADDKRRKLYPLLLEYHDNEGIPLATPLLSWVYHGYPRNAARRLEARELVRMFIARGVNINTPDGYWRRTPLMIAAMAGDVAVVKQLLKAGARVNAASRGGRTALFTRHYPAARILLEHGARVFVRDESESTPLHQAVYYKPELVRLLMRYGADPHARDSRGRTPLTIARAGNRLQVVRVLRGLPPKVATSKVKKRRERKLIITTKRLERVRIDRREIKKAIRPRKRKPVVKKVEVPVKKKVEEKKKVVQEIKKVRAVKKKVVEEIKKVPTRKKEAVD